MRNQKVWMMSFLCMASYVSADTVALIDFGYKGSQTTKSKKHYNNVIFSKTNVDHQSSGDIPLSDVGKVATGWVINVTETGTGQSGSGNKSNVSDFPGSLSSAHPESVLSDHLWANELHGNTAQLTVSIFHLNPQAHYDLMFYGSRKKKSESDIEQVWELVDGTGGGAISHVVDENPSTVVHWRKIKPDARGHIVFTITRSGAGRNRRPVAINFGSISTNGSVAPARPIAAQVRNADSGEEGSTGTLIGFGGLSVKLK